MRHYRIKMTPTSFNFCMVNFEIVEPHYDGQDYWIFDSLEEAKDAGIAYLEEQDADRVNSDSTALYCQIHYEWETIKYYYTEEGVKYWMQTLKYFK